MTIMDTSNQDRVIDRPRFSRALSRWILLGVLLTLLAAFLLFRMRGWLGADRSLSKQRLRFALVERGDLTREVSVEGTVVAASYPTIYAPAEGRISLRARAGDRVKAGDMLAIIESPELRSLLRQEQAQLASIEADLTRQKIAGRTTNLANQQDLDLKTLRLETARRELDRSRQLLDQGLINRSDYDAAVDDVRIAELEAKHAAQKAELDRSTLDLEVQNRERQYERQQLVVAEARRKVEQLELRSPVSGMVGSLSVDPEDKVTTNQQVMTVIDLSEMEIEIRIPENVADDVAISHPAEVTYNGVNYAGRVSSVAPEVNQSTVTGRVVFDDGGPENLRQNQRVATRIILDHAEAVMKVRRGPFYEAGGGTLAFVVRGDVAYRTRIETGSTSLTEVEIRAGVQTGDRLIISDTSSFLDAETVYLRN